MYNARPYIFLAKKVKSWQLCVWETTGLGIVEEVGNTNYSFEAKVLHYQVPQVSCGTQQQYYSGSWNSKLVITAATRTTSMVCRPG